ncbi:MAG: glutathione synthase [Gemmataceae bacterium]
MTNRKLAVIMDSIAAIKPQKDSTLAMLLEAQSRGWEIHYAEIDDIWLCEGEALGRLTGLKVADDPASWFEFGDVDITPLGDMDVILMRKDPPFNMEYITATYILELAEDQGALVVNQPQSLRDVNEKVSVAKFPNCAPPTLISRSQDQMRSFVEEHHKVVVKPLDLMGGQSVFVTDAQDGNSNVILETVTNNGTRTAMVQKYLPEIVTSGDKRIILIDGDPIPMALARIPSPGDHRGNMVAGATTEVKPLTLRDKWLCEQIRPFLREKGLIFTGVDVIGDFLTEINVTSPTGIREIERASGISISGPLFDAISSQLD